jgi:ABC-2 type transport system permease protein
MVTTLVLFNETRKGLLIAWSYKFNTFTMLFRNSFFFVFISLLMGGGRLDQESLAPRLLGFLVWWYAAIGISQMGWALMEEAQTGTLEQMYMASVPTEIILLGRSFAALVLATAMILMIGTGLAPALDIRIPMRWEALPVFGLTMVGLFGFGFVMAGATIVFKQVQQLANLAEQLLLYLGGALLPVHNLPGWLEAFSRTLPTTQGIIVLRNVVLDGGSLASTWGDGSLMWLMLHSMLYFVIGWLGFKWLERIARKQGTLGQY